MTDQLAVFFYGLFMDVDLLIEKGIVPANPRRAVVEGFGLRIGSRATLVASKNERSYGIVMKLTQQQLALLYSGPGLEIYRPETITCKTLDGEILFALCYNVPDPPAANEANEEYVKQLRAVLTKLHFPREYIESVG